MNRPRVFGALLVLLIAIFWLASNRGGVMRSLSEPSFGGAEVMMGPSERPMWDSGAGGLPAQEGAMAPGADFATFDKSEMSERLSIVTALPVQNGGGPSGSQVTASATPPRYLIRNGSMIIEAEEVPVAEKAILAEVKRVNGFIGNQHTQRDSLGRVTIDFTLRIPADKFDSFLGAIQGTGTVLDHTVGSDDVTEDYVDSSARLRNLKQTELRLLSHLENSKRLEDILLAEQEITRVRGEIERLEGHLRYLDDRIDFATLTLTLRPAAAAEPVIPPTKFSPAQVASEAARELTGFGQGLLAQVIWLGVWAIVWIPLVLLAWWLLRRIGRWFFPESTRSQTPA